MAGGTASSAESQWYVHVAAVAMAGLVRKVTRPRGRIRSIRAWKTRQVREGKDVYVWAVLGEGLE